MSEREWADETVGDRQDEEPEQERFAELLDSYSPELKASLEMGEKVTARIISIGSDTVFVDSGTKIDGVVERAELCAADGSLPYRVGDNLELYVVAVSESEIRLSRAMAGSGGLDTLKAAFADRIPVEGKVLETCKGGFRVELLKRRAFCPVSQMDVRHVASPETHVGQTYRFLITQLEESGRNVVVSRRRLLQREQEKAVAGFLESIQSGDILPGTVTRLMPYGAFVELLPGLEGMVHVSELSWSRVESPETVVKSGDRVNVRFLGLQPGKSKGQTKLALSLKQAQADPWQTVASRFKVGEKVQGRVTRCMDFGAFVEIAPGIEGLVHVSQMSFARRVNRPDEVVSPGQSVAVMIKGLEPEQRRISLSMRDAEGDPWVTVAGKYAEGQRIDGIVQGRESFGLFVALEPGVTGLLHKSKISRSPLAGQIEKLRAGDPIAVVIEKISRADRKIALDLGNEAEEGNWKPFASGGRASVGALGEQLQRALGKERPKG